MVEDFYDELQLAINHKPASDMLILMGDFNAKVGTDYQNWDGVLEKFGMGDCNERGEKTFQLLRHKWSLPCQHLLQAKQSI